MRSGVAEVIRGSAFALFAAFVLSALFIHGTFLTKAPISGFGAFYCAGKAVLAGRDPYRVEPLLRCERSLPSYRYSAAGVVEPAPLPPFVLGGFAVLAVLPFAYALSAFLALSVAAVGAATWALARITGLSIPFVGASLLLAALYENLVLAEVPPLATGALSVAALLLERRRFGIAALVASLSLVQPHVAAPALVALFVTYRQVRLPLAVIAAFAVALSFVALSPATTIEYFVRVLPAHAASEVIANDQLSLTWVLHQLGTGDRIALAAGSASYLTMALIGVLVARRLAVRYDRPSLVILLPVAFALIGGNYIHGIQISIALPAAIVLLAAVSGPARVVLLAAAAMLAAPWNGGLLLWAGAAVVAIQVWDGPYARGRILHRAAGVAAACLAYGLALGFITTLPGSSFIKPAVVPDVSGRADDLASSVWSRYVHVSSYGTTSPQNVAQKVPFWLGLLLVAGVAARDYLRPPPAPVRPVASGAGAVALAREVREI